MIYSLEVPDYCHQDEMWYVYGWKTEGMFRGEFKTQIEAWKFYFENAPEKIAFCPCCNQPIS